MIIYFEDDLQYGQNIKRNLEGKGFKIKVYSNIYDYNNQEADLFMVDLNLNNQLSFDLIKDIRKKSYAPIMILSAYCNNNYQIEGLKAGANCFSDKAISPSVLEAKINAHIDYYKKLINKK